MTMSPLQMFFGIHLMGLLIGGRDQVFCVMDVSFDMASDSLDDQYNGCDSDMEKNLRDPAQLDFASQSEYKMIWEDSKAKWGEKKNSPRVPKNFDEAYGTAIIAYTQDGPLYRDFNKAVREGGISTDHYQNNFYFKSFHFLLTRALQALKAGGSSCYTVYHGIDGVQFTISDQKQPVRFGQFASLSLKREVAKGFGTDTFFTIKTCLGVNITEFSVKPAQKEVLIPPYEKFRVISFREETGTTYIELEDNEKYSNFNCASKSGATPSALAPGVPASLLLWGFLLFCGALGSMGIL